MSLTELTGNPRHDQLLMLMPHSQTHPFPLQLISCGAKGGKNALYL